MKDNIYYQKSKDLFEELSDSLSLLVEDLKVYKKKPAKEMKFKIYLDLDKMTKLVNILGGILEKNFHDLKKDVCLFLDLPNDDSDVMLRCVELKNHLWEL